MGTVDKNTLCHVYCHLNKTNGKIYIGITTCRNVWRRWYKNGNGYKPLVENTNIFYNAIQKYGWDGFEHIILISDIPLYQAEIIEKELIKKYNTTDRNYGYNIVHGGIGGCGNHKKVNQYTLDGTFVKTWDSIVQAATSVNRCANDIASCCKGLRKTLANYQWRFFDDVKNTNDIESYIPKIKSIIQYDLNGNFIKLWNSAREIYEVLGFKIDTIQAACSGIHASACDFQWRYADDVYVPNKNICKYAYSLNKQVDQFDMDWNYIRTWDSITEAEIALNIARGSITHCCKGKYKQSGGYRWQYAYREVA